MLSIREGSRRSPLFAHLTDAEAEKRSAPSWIELDESLFAAKIVGVPRVEQGVGLDYTTVFEFYSR